MTGAMSAAIAGLKTHMKKLNVISNNVANVNTYAYKAASAAFSEAIYSTVKSGADGTAVSGGINPSQIGYGANIGAISMNMTAGDFTATGRGLDSMITGGGGFYLVGEKGKEITSDNLDSLTLTRYGRFDFDADGYLVDESGNVVYGFVSATNGQPTTTNLSIKDNPYRSQNPNQTVGVSTELVPIRLPLMAKASGDGENAIKAGTSVYAWVDEDGKTHYGNEDDEGALITGNESLVEVDPDTGRSKRINIESVTIDPTGAITAINGDTDEVVLVGYLAIGMPENPAGVTHTEGPYYKALGGAGDIRIGTPDKSVNGYLNNLTNDGDNGAESKDLLTTASKLLPGGLEMSGTDVSTEFTEMITTQRGYQANTRIITVTDSMLEELVNMKR